MRLATLKGEEHRQPSNHHPHLQSDGGSEDFSTYPTDYL
jgi:hypothetical protein